MSHPPHQHASAPTQAAASPAACYRELRRFPAVTRAALGSVAGGQTFLLYTGEWWAQQLGALCLRARCRQAVAATVPSCRVQPPRCAPPPAPALQPPLQPAAYSQRPRRQPGSAQHRDPQPVWHGRAVGWGGVAGAHRVAGAHSTCPPQPASLPPAGSSARTRPRGSTVPCSADARGRATSCWR